MQNAEITHSKNINHVLVKNRNFLFLLLGGATSLLGYRSYLVIMSWFVVSLTGSSKILGMLFAFWAVPNMIFMLIGGSLADRFNRVKMMFFSNLSRVCILLLLALLYFFGLVEVWMLFFVSIIFGISNALFVPSRDSLIPHIVENNHLQKANALNQFFGQTSYILGPLVAVVAVNIFGDGYSFIIPALFILMSAVFIRKIQNKSEDKLQNRFKYKELLGGIQQGYKIVKSNIALLYLFISMAIFNLGYFGPLTIGLPVLTVNELDVGIIGFSILEIALAIGMIVGSIICSKWKIKRTGIVIFTSTVLAGVIFASISLFANIIIIAVLLSLVGCLITLINISMFTTIQTSVPSEFLGSVFGLLNFIVVGMDPVTFLISGLSLEYLTVSKLFLIGGTLITFVGLIGLYIKPTRNLITK
jgi:MFS transporter, DHA3 family, macrolide efflux protein